MHIAHLPVYLVIRDNAPDGEEHVLLLLGGPGGGCVVRLLAAGAGGAGTVPVAALAHTTLTIPPPTLSFPFNPYSRWARGDNFSTLSMLTH